LTTTSFGRRLALAVTLTGLLGGASLGAQAKPFALDDYDRLVRLRGARLSADGASALVVVGRANLQENRYDYDLVLVTVASGGQRVLVSSRPGLSQPVFVPGQDAVAFLADVPGSEAGAAHAQVHVVSPGGEPRVLTRTPSGVDAFAVSPDGRTVAFTAEDPAPERQGAARFQDAFEVGNNGVTERSAPRASHLWTVPLEGGEPRRVTRGGFSFATGLGASPLAFSPDGRQVLATRTVTPLSGDARSARVHTVELASGLQARLTLRGGHESDPLFSPDGRSVVFLHPREGDVAGVTEAYVAFASGQDDGRSASRALDRSIASARFLADGRSLLLGGNDGTRMALWIQPPDAAARRLDLGAVVEHDGVTASADGSLLFVGTERDRGPELYFLERPGAAGAPAGPAGRRLTDFNPLTGFALGRTEGFEWPSSDGLVADGVLTYPPDFSASRTWPLVLLIHGGPTAASNESFDPLAQLLAARGWLVLQPNYRGSDNRGNAFQRAIVSGAGEGPGQDVMAGVEALRKRGFVDASRLAVSGWSYGGFMTGWMVGRYPDSWRAAVMGASALDLFDMWSLSDLSAQPRHALTGSPFLGEAAAREQSPLTHVAKVRTPTLLLSNAADARVAVSQSYKWFRALRDRDVDARFFVYPTGGHTPGGPVRQKDVWRRWIEWIDRRFAAGS